MKCIKCNCEHNGLFGSGKFCSRSCANSRGPRTEDFKRKVSEKLSGQKTNIWNRGKKFVHKIDRKCYNCENTFKVHPRGKRIYCSRKCNPNIGGYREGSGKSHSGYYKGIYCGSTYELVWVIYRLDNNLPFKRFSGIIEGGGIKYIPDFLVDNTIYEMKGYENIDKVQAKTELAESQGYNVIVLYKEDLYQEHDWVRNNYSYNSLKELYDDYKTNYKYNCSNCNCSVERDKKANTKDVFCSKFCSGQYRAKIKHGILIPSHDQTIF